MVIWYDLHCLHWESQKDHTRNLDENKFGLIFVQALNIMKATKLRPFTFEHSQLCAKGAALWFSEQRARRGEGTGTGRPNANSPGFKTFFIFFSSNFQITFFIWSKSGGYQIGDACTELGETIIFHTFIACYLFAFQLFSVNKLRPWDHVTSFWFIFTLKLHGFGTSLGRPNFVYSHRLHLLVLCAFSPDASLVIFTSCAPLWWGTNVCQDCPVCRQFHDRVSHVPRLFPTFTAQGRE